MTLVVQPLHLKSNEALPNKSLKIEVHFHPKNKGYFMQQVMVESNAHDSPHLLAIRGKVF
ncbi:MAG: DUF1573 domain-containing protein [Runella sp.]